MDIPVPHWGCWLILMKGECYQKGHIYFCFCSVNQATAYEPPSISLCPTRRAVLSSYWMLMMSTPAPVVADLRIGPKPSLIMVLVHRLGHNWQAKPAGICCGSTGPWLWKPWLPAAIYYWTQVASFPLLLSPHQGTLQAECWLNQSWHAECPWVDWHSSWGSVLQSGGIQFSVL